MSLSPQQTAQFYIQQLSDIMVPVTVVINDSREIAGCKLLFESKKKREILIRLRAGRYPESGEVKITCSYSQALYIFKSSIVGIPKTDSKHTYLKIKFPDKIVRKERRRFIRVKPSEREPISVQFLSGVKKTVTAEATDISGGGVSCVLPDNLAKFRKGDSFHLSITFPIFGEITAWVTVRSMTSLLDMARISMVYSIMSDHVHSIIMSYVAVREREIRSESSNTRQAVKSLKTVSENCLPGYSKRLLNKRKTGKTIFPD